VNSLHLSKPHKSFTAMLRLCLVLILVLAWSAAHAQENRTAAADTNEGARALWAEFMDRLHADYHEVVDEAALTRKAVDLLAAQNAALASMPKPKDYGTTPELHRNAFHQYIVAFAVKAGRRVTASTVVELAIQALCERELRFAQYIPAGIQAELGSLGQANLGMRIEVGEDGRFYCQPFPGEAAALAGIDPGDELIALDGVPLEGMNRWKLKVKLYGTDGSKAEVRVRKSTGRVITTELTRRITGGLRVTVASGIGGSTIRIPLFDGNTLPDLRAALQKVKPGSPLTLDLRGNGGGEIPPAVDAAALFIEGPRPLVLCKQQRRGHPDVELSSDETMIPGFKRLMVLMDSGTASSAELFIAILSEAPSLRVALSGSRTYGKDLWLEGATLKNGGGELYLPTGNMLTAGGKRWPKGIEPTFGVKKLP